MKRTVTVRRATTVDVPDIQRLIQPYVDERILLGKELVQLYEAVQEFRVAIDENGHIVGCGALHVMWSDLGEVRTLAVDRSDRGHGVGHAMLEALEEAALELGLARLVCLTFETEFFQRHGYLAIGEKDEVIDKDAMMGMLRSADIGIAEFLDLAHVKQNTLGNTRMIKLLGMS